MVQQQPGSATLNPEDVALDISHTTAVDGLSPPNESNEPPMTASLQRSGSYSALEMDSPGRKARSPGGPPALLLSPQGELAPLVAGGGKPLTNVSSHMISASAAVSLPPLAVAVGDNSMDCRLSDPGGDDSSATSEDDDEARDSAGPGSEDGQKKATPLLVFCKLAAMVW